MRYTSPELRSTWFLRQWERHQVPNLAFSRMPKNPTLTAFFLLKRNQSHVFKFPAKRRKLWCAEAVPGLQDSKVALFQSYMIPGIHNCKFPWFQSSKVSEFQVAGFQIFPGFQGCNVTGQKIQISQGCKFPRF